MKNIKYYGTLLSVWIVGVIVANYVLHLGADSLRMVWGAFVGAFAVWLGLCAERH